MGVYTKTGDQGTTGLLTGERVAKSCLRVRAYGSVDEANSALGLARAFCEDGQVKEELFKLQKMNMLLMAQLASRSNEEYVSNEQVKALEAAIDQYEGALPPLKEFIVPGGSKGGAMLDLARTAVRRAEREVWALSAEEEIKDSLLILLNRLSDLCFVLMRYEERKK